MNGDSWAAVDSALIGVAGTLVAVYFSSRLRTKQVDKQRMEAARQENQEYKNRFVHDRKFAFDRFTNPLVQLDYMIEGSRASDGFRLRLDPITNNITPESMDRLRRLKSQHTSNARPYLGAIGIFASDVEKSARAVLHAADLLSWPKDWPDSLTDVPPGPRSDYYAKSDFIYRLKEFRSCLAEFHRKVHDNLELDDGARSAPR